MKKVEDNFYTSKHLKTIAENIRHQRLVKNYSQDYLATRLAISQNAYSKIELGYTRITIERAFNIADILEINVLMIFHSDVDTKVRQIQIIDTAGSDEVYYSKNNLTQKGVVNGIIIY